MSRPLAVVAEGPLDGTRRVVLSNGKEMAFTSPRVAAEYVVDINTAHEAAMSGLQARLAMAREALRLGAALTEDRFTGSEITTKNRALLEAIQAGGIACRDALAAIDAEAPPEMVPKAKLDEALAVLADLREEKRSPYEERCRRALVALRVNWNSGYISESARVERAEAILEGRDEPGPAKATDNPTLDAISARLARIPAQDWAAVGADFRAVGDDLRSVLPPDPEEP